MDHQQFTGPDLNRVVGSVVRKLLIAALLLLASCLPSHAWRKGSAANAVVGNAVLNLGDNLPNNFVNLFNIAATDLNTRPADILKLDANGYFVSRPGGDTSFFSAGVGTFWTNTGYTLSGSATRLQPMLVLSGAFTSCSVTSGAVTITGCTGSGNTTFTPTAGPWSVTFNVGTDLGAWYWNGTGGTYAAGSGAIALYRTSDAARYASGIIFTSEFESLVSGSAANPLRNMPWVDTGNSNYNNETLWAYRKTLNSFSFQGSSYPPGALVGGGSAVITVTNSGTTTITASAAPDTPGTLTDGEVALGFCSASNTFAAPTLDVGSRGAKPIYNYTGDLLSASAITSGQLCFFTYKTLYDGWIFGSPSSSGIAWSLPVEVFAQLANRTNKDAWFNLPFMATDGYVSSWAAAIRDNLNPSLKAYFEYSNEVWNTFFPQTGWSANQGYKLGWVPQSNQAIDSWYALRFKQMMGLVNTAFTGQTSRARGVQLYPAVLGPVFGTFPNRLSGAQLVNNKQTTASVTITVGSPCQIVWPFNGFQLNWPVSFTGTTLPIGITSAQIYFVKTISPDNNNVASTITISATQGGAAINCSGATLGVTGSYINTFYAAAINQNYSQGSPTFSRPIDVAYGVGSAPYAGGENLCLGADINCSPAAKNAPFLQSLVTAWEAPNPTAAIALVDQDIRAGTTNGQTVTASTTTFTTPTAHGFTANSTDVLYSVSGGTAYSGVSVATLYRVLTTPTSTTFTIQAYGTAGVPAGAAVNAGSAGSGTMSVGASAVKTLANVASTWIAASQFIAAGYNSDRPAATPNLFNMQYEGNLEPVGPSAGQCTTLGITGSNCAASIQAAITAWKNSASGKATQTLYYNQFMGRDSGTPATFGLMGNSKAPAQLTLMPPSSECTTNQYALIAGCLSTDTPYQTYYGFRDFSLSN